MKNSIFQTIAAITYPYGILPEVEETEFHQCEQCGAYTDRKGCRAVSNCCNAYRTDTESDLCPRCKEHCEFQCENGDHD